MSLRLVRQMLPWRVGRGPVRADTTVTWFRVAPSDLDVLLHMNNGRYLSILDAGRVDMFVRGGLWAALRRQGWHPVVAAQSITYIASLTFGTRFSVTTRLLGFDTKNAYLEQTFDAGGRTCASAVVALRMLDGQGRSVPSEQVVALFDPAATPVLIDSRDVPLGRRTQHDVVTSFDRP
ncbi:thioesterase family protein [Rhodococcoides corynebacterioides]|uniref:Thioesterase family protein n=1 Tax=Rhodococcoides corynebacterioides TaxID=53972 RepID=A0ABS7P5H5_9NOCA|nr:thioesterase family protein [Rhodococcus corynebacterioides]MBY6367679.1 thioesterase family protein [Rhodococcus corynebacterioides]MBY6407987.1 thioesterase family protein [Rhodococcus corynebacterioides]